MNDQILAEPRSISQRKSLKEFNVLYVDDESINLRLFEMAFKRYYNVFIAESAQKAMEILKTENIQLIVTDQKMPQMTGTQLLENTTEDYPDIMRIILTGYADLEAIVQAINKCKIYKYITKPYDQSDMKLTLDKALELFKVKKEKKGLVQELADINKDLERKVKARTRDLEEANQRLTDGLLFAQTIQETMLPKEKELTSSFSDAFVIYHPKDFVGGDFFWFKNITVKGRELSVIAVVDCMGHGVAGALLSMIGETQLNQIVAGNDDLEADQILTRLDAGLRKALERSDSGATMDVTLAIVDKTENNLHFSGAKLDFIYFKNDELLKIKGTRKSVGSTWNEQLEFENHTVDLEGVTEFYMFSDGFQDQFGADNQKKYGSKRLLELISDSRSSQLSDQREKIETTFSDWKQDTEQVDDVTLIGIKV